MERLKNFLEKFFCGDRLKNFCEDVFFFWRSSEKFLWRPFFFWRALALVSLVLGLGLEHSCPWPRECLSSERLSLASDFFCVLGLEPCVLDSTSDWNHNTNEIELKDNSERLNETFRETKSNLESCVSVVSKEPSETWNRTLQGVCRIFKRTFCGIISKPNFLLHLILSCSLLCKSFVRRNCCVFDKTLVFTVVTLHFWNARSSKQLRCYV